MQETKQMRIYHLLKERIESGFYPPGHLFPDEPKLAKELSVSRDQQPDRGFVAMDDIAPVNDDAHPVIQRRQEFGSFRKQMLQGGTVDHQAFPVHDFRLKSLAVPSLPAGFSPRPISEY